jgi:protein DGCR14
MFGPESVEDDVQTVQQKAEDASRAGPKAVVYANTRMPPPPELAAAEKVPASPSLSAINDAIAGRPRRTASELGDQSGGETPRVNGYAFVDPEASPEPEPQPQTDWSKFSLGPGDAALNPFTIKEKSSREELHHRMVDKVAKSKRTQQLATQAKTPVPKFMSSPRPGKGGLTPAGQRLLGTVGGKTPGGSIWEGSSTPRAQSNLGAGWTPKLKTPRK